MRVAVLGLGAASIKAAPATTRESNIEVAEIAVFEQLTGRSYRSDERELMVGGLQRMRGNLKRVRAAKIPPDTDPALHFDPRPAGFVMPKIGTPFEPTKPLVKYDGNPASLAFATIGELSTLIAARKVTSTELTKMYLDRLKRIGPKLFCVVTLTEELALKQATKADAEITAGKTRGPLHGIPWGAKDLLATKGIRTTWGAKPYIDQVFDEDADVVKKLHAAGAVLVAKLSLGELAMGDVWFGGKTRNPWKIEEGSNGSSAGPASATAAGLVAFAIGSETLGSIVSPSLQCGVTGLRPTYGAVSRHGAMPLSQSMDKIGPMARCVQDCALVYDAIREAHAPFGNANSLRIGIIQSAFDGVKDTKQRKLFDAALDMLREQYGELKPITLPPADKYRGLTSITIASESAGNFSDLLDTGKIRDLAQQDDGAWPTEFRIGTTVPAPDYLRAQRLRSILIEDMAAAMKDIDLYVTVPYAGVTLSYTNLTGHPSLIARCGVIDEKPVGLELIGGLFREDAIIQAGMLIEQASAPKVKWPELAQSKQ